MAEMFESATVSWLREEVIRDMHHCDHARALKVRSVRGVWGEPGAWGSRMCGDVL
jgi:hypothetical protein